MHKILKIAQREYIETAKTKTFILSVVFAPIIIIGIILYSQTINQSKTGPRPALKILVTDHSSKLNDEMRTSFDKYNTSHPNRQIILEESESYAGSESVEKDGKEKLRNGQLDGYIVFDSDVIEGEGKIHLYTYKPKASNIDMLWTIENLCKKSVVNYRYQQQELDRQMLEELRYVATEQVEIGALDDDERVEGKGDRIAKMMVPFFFMYLMFLGIVSMGQHILGSIIEEKSSRVIEVLLSAVSPFQLMSGKILGLSGVGITVITIWGALAYAGVWWQGINIEISAELLLYFIIYYILGFVLFSAILAGVGSVCNTVKETQSLMMPVMLVFMIPIIAWFKLVQDPDGTLSRVLSFVPPLTSMVMILRLSASPDISLFEIAASIFVLAVSVLAVIWLAAKVFRTGILMYGKRPRVREILRWLRQS